MSELVVMASPRCRGYEPKHYVTVLGDHKTNRKFNTMIFFIGKITDSFVFFSMHEVFYRIDINPGSNESVGYYREQFLYCMNTAVSVYIATGPRPCMH